MAADIDEALQLAFLVTRHDNRNPSHHADHDIARVGYIFDQAEILPAAMENRFQLEFVDVRIEIGVNGETAIFRELSFDSFDVDTEFFRRKMAHPGSPKIFRIRITFFF